MNEYFPKPKSSEKNVKVELDVRLCNKSISKKKQPVLINQILLKRLILLA